MGRVFRDDRDQSGFRCGRCVHCEFDRAVGRAMRIAYLDLDLGRGRRARNETGKYRGIGAGHLISCVDNELRRGGIAAGRNLDHFFPAGGTHD